MVFATSGSVLALAQNAQAAENAKTDIRTWGPEANGLALSIGVDKTTYVVGQPIPLHIAFRNAHASEGMTLGICEEVALTVRNEKGKKFAQVDDADRPCSYSGPRGGPLVSPGGMVASDQNLMDYQLPPGRYTVVGEWDTAAYQDRDEPPRATQVFHVHSNLVMIRIVAPEQP